MATPQSGLVTRNVPSVIGGVSNKDPLLRRQSQATELTNMLPRINEALRRRPGSVFVTKLTGDIDVESEETGSCSIFTHSYNRDLNEQYLIIVSDGQIAVVNTKTLEVHEVDMAEGSEEYLASTDPIRDFRACTVGDKTFLVNRNVTVAESETEESPDPPTALVWLRVAGVLSAVYGVNIDGVPYSVETHSYATDTFNLQRVTTALEKTIPKGDAMSTVTFGGIFKDGDNITITDTISGKTSTIPVYALADLWRSDALGIGYVQGETVATAVAACRTYFTQLLLNDQGNLSDIFPTEAEVSYLGDKLIFVGANINLTVGTNSAGGTVLVENTGVRPNTYALDYINGDSMFSIKRVDDGDFSISSISSVSDILVDITKGQAQSLASLPSVSKEGYKVKITGGSLSLRDDYWVEYDIANTAENQGVWVETRKSGENVALDPDTMPHVLTRESDGSFFFGPHTWDERTVGDSLTNPMPSFVGKKITDVFFFKQRLGVSAGEGFAFTEIGEYGNFFRTTILSLLDSDPIDVTISDAKLAIIHHVTPHASDLILWSDNGQFLIPGSVPLTPKTVAAPMVSAFSASPMVKPTSSGRLLHFAQDLDSTTKVFEYSADGASGETNRRDADDLSVGLVKYLDGSPYALTSTRTGSLVVLNTCAAPNDLFVCSQEWERGDESKARKIMSSWGRWRFGSTDNSILAVECIDNRLFFIVERGNELTLEVINLEQGDLSPALDCKLHSRLEPPGLSSFYDEMNDTTTWTLPIAIPDSEDYPLVVIVEETGEKLEVTRPSDNTVEAEGDYTSSDVIIGIHYGGEWEWTPLHLTDERTGDSVALTDSRLDIRYVDLNYADSRSFEVLVTLDEKNRPGVDPKAYPFSSDELESGTIRFPVLSQNTKARIKVSMNDHLPASFTSFAWTGNIATIAKRV